MKVIRKRQFDLAFKREAVQASLSSAETVAAVAGRLGVHPGLLSRWRRQLTMADKTNKPEVENKGPDRSLRDLERENKRLKKALKRAELEAEILKKAQEHFAKLRK